MALVHPTSENLSEANKFTDALHSAAGPDLQKEIKTENLRKSFLTLCWKNSNDIGLIAPDKS